jgi:hypothetical protein
MPLAEMKRRGAGVRFLNPGLGFDFRSHFSPAPKKSTRFTGASCLGTPDGSPSGTWLPAQKIIGGRNVGDPHRRAVVFDFLAGAKGHYTEEHDFG